MSPVRVGVVGARRRRQGLGPFVVRDLLAAGAVLHAFLATREQTRDETAAQLARATGHAPRGYLDIDAMLEAESLDALVILSPHETHPRFLRAALEAGLHALCEKPLVWGSEDLAGTAATLVAGFAERGLQLWENCQWPYTLVAFERLHPGSLDAPPRHFRMELQPASPGESMLADALPHPLSLLQRLVPGRGPGLADLRIRAAAPDDSAREIRFAYLCEGHRVEVEVALRPTQAHPRETCIAIDGRAARRVVSPEDYRLWFRGEGRAVPLDDPLPRLVTDFVQELEKRPEERAPSRSQEMVERMGMLAEIARAWRNADA